VRPLREFGPPVLDQIGVMPYGAVQSMLDGSFPRGRQYYWKAHLIGDIGAAAVDAVIDSFASVPSPFSMLGFQQLGNAANRVAPDATAFSHRDARYDFLMLAGWEGPSDAETNVAWARKIYDAMRPSLHAGIYINGLGADSGPQVKAAFRTGTYARLLALKRKYDPKNLFRLNPNIDPAV
jgi:hypothetical protein